MSHVYLVRHGQAGTRDEYDRLSDLGRRQARMLGEYFAAQPIAFSAAYSGFMRRQQETALEVQTAYRDTGIDFPEVAPRREWDEFNLDRVYRELAPMMCRDDPQFRQQYEEMRAQVRASAGAQQAEVHRRWLPCDSQIMGAWITGRYPYAGESWQVFTNRVASFRDGLRNGAPDANIVIFTSAVPVAIWAALALEITDRRILRLAGVLQNTAYTVLRLEGDILRLHAFNSVPHLKTELRTYR